ncbi:hypothetical protein RSAG8_03310, partial [Rhizoctonia solani AG-8 WAC10335]
MWKRHDGLGRWLSSCQVSLSIPVALVLDEIDEESAQNTVRCVYHPRISNILGQRLMALSFIVM